MSKLDEELARKRARRDAGLGPYEKDADKLGPSWDPGVVQELHQAAQKVARAYKKHQEALVMEDKAKANLLEKALAAVMPALYALASKIEKSATWQSGGTPGDSGERTYHDVEGVLLIKGFSSPTSNPSDPEDLRYGLFAGSSLYLLVDGRLAVVTMGGSWSKVKGTTSSRFTTLNPIGLQSVLDAWNIHDILEGLAEAMKTQASTRANAAKDSKVRASTVQALAEILAGVVKAVRS